MALSNPVIITDLDGTLLDHYSYQYDAALPALALIKQRQIPLILNSSKTASEIKSLREALNNSFPFVVENGAGIYLPDDTQNELIAFGIERKTILDKLRSYRQQNNQDYIGFNDMTVEQLIEYTGLEQHQAKAALARDFTEPLLWQADEAKLDLFKQQLARLDLTVTQGGRFLSVSGMVDKGQALCWLRRYYTDVFDAEVTMIALGDSHNDVPMLEAADIAIVVRSPVHDLPELSRQDAIVTQDFGPAGWNDSIMSLLQGV